MLSSPRVSKRHGVYLVKMASDLDRSLNLKGYRALSYRSTGASTAIFGSKSPSEVDTDGRSPESWLAMQRRHDLWCARKRVKLDSVRPVRFDRPGDGGQPVA